MSAQEAARRAEMFASTLRASEQLKLPVHGGDTFRAALRAHRRGEPVAVPGSTGRTVRPHIRRAHFHTFRRGPGRSERFVKWLGPIPVKVENNATRPTVVKVP